MRAAVILFFYANVNISFAATSTIRTPVVTYIDPYANRMLVAGFPVAQDIGTGVHIEQFDLKKKERDESFNQNSGLIVIGSPMADLHAPTSLGLLQPIQFLRVNRENTFYYALLLHTSVSGSETPAFIFFDETGKQSELMLLDNAVLGVRSRDGIQHSSMHRGRTIEFRATEVNNSGGRELILASFQHLDQDVLEDAQDLMSPQVKAMRSRQLRRRREWRLDGGIRRQRNTPIRVTLSRFTLELHNNQVRLKQDQNFGKKPATPFLSILEFESDVGLAQLQGVISRPSGDTLVVINEPIGARERSAPISLTRQIHILEPLGREDGSTHMVERFETTTFTVQPIRYETRPVIFAIDASGKRFVPDFGNNPERNGLEAPIRTRQSIPAGFTGYTIDGGQSVFVDPETGNIHIEVYYHQQLSGSSRIERLLFDADGRNFIQNKLERFDVDDLARPPLVDYLQTLSGSVSHMQPGHQQPTSFYDNTYLVVNGVLPQLEAPFSGLLRQAMFTRSQNTLPCSALQLLHEIERHRPRIED